MKRRMKITMWTDMTFPALVRALRPFCPCDRGARDQCAKRPLLVCERCRKVCIEVKNVKNVKKEKKHGK